MKKLLFILFLLGSFTISHAQFLNFGIKGGISYNSNGELSISDLTTFDSNQEMGYHIGILTEIKLPLWLYVRPELYYTHTESSYKSELQGKETKLSMNKIDIPILLGFRVLKIGRAFFGPSFHYILSNDLSHADEVSSDDFTLGGQAGIGIELGKFGADVRWEMGFTDTEALFNPATLVDTQQQQVILGIYYKFR